MADNHPLKGIADALASKGRYGDTMLVHMSPQEVRGLGSLVPGGELPINPDTGQPEAFDLGSFLLPILGGIGGAFLGPAGLGIGATLGGALGAGAGGIAAGALQGKDAVSSIGQGIASGLLSYGLGSAVDLMGAGAGAGEAVNFVPQPGMAGNVAANAEAGLVPTGLPGSEAIAGGANVPAPYTYNPSLPDFKQPGFLDSSMYRAEQAGQGFANDPLGSMWNTFGKNAAKTTLPMAAGLYGMGAMGTNESAASMPPPMQQQYPGRTAQNTKGPFTPPPAGYRPGTDPEHRYFPNYPQFKDGGKVKGETDWVTSDSPYRMKGDRGDTIMNLKAAEEAALEYDKRREEFGDFASRGYQGKSMPPIWKYEGGGPVSGPGGGLDDAIPAIIDGRQPAALSSGEWVAPASMVSALGNGSTEEGIRQLESMADRVMKAKYGTKDRTPRGIDPREMMPV